jgi:hypothetical protein
MRSVPFRPVAGNFSRPQLGEVALNLLRRHCVEFLRRSGELQEAAMTGIDLIDKLADLQRQYADAHRPARSVEHYRERHARRHPECNYDGERHVSQYQTRQ